MASVGRLVELLRDESWKAKAAGEQAVGEELWELAEEPGNLSEQQEEWVGQADDEDLKGFVQEVRRGEWQ